LFELATRVRQERLARGPRPRDPTAFVVVGCIAGAVAAAELIGRRGPLVWPGGLVWPVIAGLAAVAGGLALRAWAVVSLGRFFQCRIQIQPGHRIVERGPYRYVRHPSYTGLALILLGIGLASGDVLSLVAVAVLGAIGLRARIHAEERQLASALGPEYARFAAGRRRLVPGLW
jgi:protein-S-isoprenylcysteine O-methyltransferase Ste14